MSAVRTSPLAHLLAARHPQLAEHRGMRIAMALGGETPAQVSTAGVCDLCALARIGLKGPGAADWLQARGIPVPAQPNSWTELPDGGLVARLARTEFLVEDGLEGQFVAPVQEALRAGLAGVYPVRRQDCALALTGARIPELLVQTCNVDFSAQPPEQHIVTLTSMAGVSVTLLRRDAGGRLCYRLWCDSTFGPYVWETLTEIATELGGGPAGAASVFDIRM